MGKSINGKELGKGISIWCLLPRITDRRSSSSYRKAYGSLQMTMDLYCHVTDDTLFEAMRLMEKVV